MKKLYRSETNKTFTGLLGGLGKYTGIDPIIIRIIFILFLLFSGVWPAVVVYIIGYFVVPIQPGTEVDEKKETDGPRIHDV